MGAFKSWDMANGDILAGCPTLLLHGRDFGGTVFDQMEFGRKVDVEAFEWYTTRLARTGGKVEVVRELLACAGTRVV